MANVNRANFDDVVHSDMFLYRVIPRREGFVEGMSQEEAEIMVAHRGYWTRLLWEGKVIAFGRVFDETSPHGLAIVNVPDEQSVEDLIARDPAITSGICRPQYDRMLVVHRSHLLTG